MGLSLALKQQALNLGFDLVGVAPAAVWRDLEFSRRWVEKGYGGAMRYLENPQRDDPRRILPSVKSLICVGLVYDSAHPYSTEASKAESSDRKAEGFVAALSEHREITAVADRRYRRQKAERSEQQAHTSGPRGWISRYAWGKDYHGVVRAKLEKLRAAVEELAPGVETRVFVDTGPVVERAFARHSGIGWMGKNTCLINETKGSWFFLGVMLTNLELEPDLPTPDHCGSCTACLEACPTGALVEPYVMDASRCISYLTIELKGSIPDKFRSAIGANVFGCDICQDGCPWNSKWRSQEAEVRSQNGIAPRRGDTTTSVAEFQPMQVQLGEGLCGPSDDLAGAARSVPATAEPGSTGFSLFNPPLEALSSLREEDFRHIFAHSPIKRAKYRGWLRNLCVAMGNSGDARFVPWLKGTLEHPDPIVREHAAWALKQLEYLSSPGSQSTN